MDRAMSQFGRALPVGAPVSSVIAKGVVWKSEGLRFGFSNDPFLRKYGKLKQAGSGTGRLVRVRCQKMFVPGFGEKSPEKKAADSLHNFFTFIAVKIVLSQLQDYNREAYEELSDFVDRVSLKDGDKFCAALLRESFRHRGLALRIMEVRSAYCNQDFEWDNLQILSRQQMDESNTTLMRKLLVETSDME